MNEAYKMEIYKGLLFAISAGFLGGLLYCAVQDYFTQSRNNQVRSFKARLMQYVFSGLLYGFFAGIVAGIALEYNSISIENIKNVNQSSIPIAIFYPPVSSAIEELINIFFRRNENR